MLLVGNSLLQGIVLAFQLRPQLLDLLVSHVTCDHLHPLLHVVLLPGEHVIALLVHQGLDLGSLLLHSLVQVLLQRCQLLLVLSNDSQPCLLQLLIGLFVNLAQSRLLRVVNPFDHTHSDVLDKLLFGELGHQILDLLLLHPLTVPLHLLLLFSKLCFTLLPNLAVLLQLTLVQLVFNQTQLQLLLSMHLR